LPKAIPTLPTGQRRLKFSIVARRQPCAGRSPAQAPGPYRPSAVTARFAGRGRGTIYPPAIRPREGLAQLDRSGIGFPRPVHELADNSEGESRF